jgi:hypothetical protein
MYPASSRVAKVPPLLRTGVSPVIAVNVVGVQQCFSIPVLFIKWRVSSQLFMASSLHIQYSEASISSTGISVQTAVSFYRYFIPIIQRRPRYD